MNLPIASIDCMRRGNYLLAILLIIGMSSSCTTIKQANSKELQPTETHDVLVDPATGAQWYVPRQ